MPKTYYVVQPFENAKKGLSKVLQPFEVPTAELALRRAELAAVRGGAIAFSRAGGEFDEPVILGRFGDVPRDFER